MKSYSEKLITIKGRQRIAFIVKDETKNQFYLVLNCSECFFSSLLSYCFLFNVFLFPLQLILCVYICVSVSSFFMYMHVLLTSILETHFNETKDLFRLSMSIFDVCTTSLDSRFLSNEN